MQFRIVEFRKRFLQLVGDGRPFRIVVIDDDVIILVDNDEMPSLVKDLELANILPIRMLMMLDLMLFPEICHDDPFVPD